MLKLLPLCDKIGRYSKIVISILGELVAKDNVTCVFLQITEIATRRSEAYPLR